MVPSLKSSVCLFNLRHTYNVGDSTEIHGIECPVLQARELKHGPFIVKNDHCTVFECQRNLPALRFSSAVDNDHVLQPLTVSLPLRPSPKPNAAYFLFSLLIHPKKSRSFGSSQNSSSPTNLVTRAQSTPSAVTRSNVQSAFAPMHYDLSLFRHPFHRTYSPSPIFEKPSSHEQAKSLRRTTRQR